MYRVVSAAIALLLYAFVPAIGANAADIKILSPGATEAVLNELLPQFEKSSGHRATITYGPAGNIANRVRKGEAVDVLISSEAEINRLRKEGHLRRRQPDDRGQDRHRHLRSQGRPEA